jgi:preprotein translocase subunit SecD
MPKGLTWRIGLLLLFFVGSVIYLVPTLAGGKLPTWWSGVLPKDKIHLGLDLQGGTHLVLEVDTPKAVEGKLDLIATDLEDTLNSKTIRFRQIGRNGSDRVTVTLYDKASADSVAKLLKERYPQMEMLPAVEDGGGFITLGLRAGDKESQDIRDKAVAQALETIRNRIDQFGVSEPIIQREGINHIVVQLPGIKDPKRAIELIGKTARLEFKLVDENVNATTATALTSSAWPSRLSSSRAETRSLFSCPASRIPSAPSNSSAKPRFWSSSLLLRTAALRMP